MTQDYRFLLVITGRDVEEYVDPLLASLAAQTYPKWRAVFVDDASSDDTLRVLRRGIEAHALPQRIDVVSNSDPLYKTQNVYRVIKEMAEGEEVVAIVDADDRIAEPRALEILESEYRRGWDVVWSNWRGSDGSAGKSDYLHPFIPPSRQPFVTEHLFSFRRRLFEEVRERDLQNEAGNWFRAGCDVAIAWPVLERTRRRRFIDRRLYTYTLDNPRSHKRSGGKRDQIETLATLRRRRRGSPPRDYRFLVAHAGYYLLSALMSTLRVGRYIRHERRIRKYWSGNASIR